ncbi:hypothetical protein CF68_33110 [Cupriavidus sp. SK-4]|uniref:hypothetical protein n=1 Tax=Cupriavidus sp. SK-4 TaxID=574750 RepID=UPI000451B36E|nr:hypothetical protein [Cupriavidus sp. SK-4]EYS89529.1 hypothetical protein CF68_33110 [Cupriavidus sp. SK-4]
MTEQNIPERTPDGYAYRYPGPYGGLRFNGGEEVNGSRPTEAVPYWLGKAADHSGDSAEMVPSAGGQQVEQLPVELRAVAETVAEGAGFWATCTGCYDTEDGRPTQKYAHSDVFGCELGNGCRECGGLGAVWDDTDYAAMVEFMEQRDTAPAPAASPALADEAVHYVLRQYFDVTAETAANVAHDLRCGAAPAPVAAPASDMGQDYAGLDCPHDTCDPAACRCASPAALTDEQITELAESYWLKDAQKPGEFFDTNKFARALLAAQPAADAPAPTAQADDTPLVRFVKHLSENCIGQVVTEDALEEWALDVLDSTPREVIVRPGPRMLVASLQTPARQQSATPAAPARADRQAYRLTNEKLGTQAAPQYWIHELRGKAKTCRAVAEHIKADPEGYDDSPLEIADGALQDAHAFESAANLIEELSHPGRQGVVLSDELLARACAAYRQEFACVLNHEAAMKAARAEIGASSSRAEEPECKTCGGRGQVNCSERIGESDFHEWEQDCPVCGGAGTAPAHVQALAARFEATHNELHKMRLEAGARSLFASSRAEVEIPASVKDWHAAWQAHVDATAAYNARWEVSRKSELGAVSLTDEYQAMTLAKNKVLRMLPTLFEGIGTVLAAAEAPNGEKDADA